MKVRGKSAIADVICYCKMTLVMSLDAVTPFYALKTLQIQENECDTVKLLAGILHCIFGKLDEAEDFKCVFAVYCVLELK